LADGGVDAVDFLTVEQAGEGFLLFLYANHAVVVVEGQFVYIFENGFGLTRLAKDFNPLHFNY
jgi:hypothetical protein